MAVKDEIRTVPSIQLDFSEGIAPKELDIAERSIQAMAAHFTKKRQRAHAEEDKQKKLESAINRPLIKLVEKEQDSVAVKGLLINLQPLNFDSDSIMHHLHSGTCEVADATLVLRDIRSQLHTPPYHYNWAWHDTNGSPPHSVVHDGNQGFVSLETRNGPFVPGSGGSFVNAHAGFGLGFRATANGLLRVDSLRFVSFGFTVGALGIGSNATTEGGTECTLFEDGNFKLPSTKRLWRKRVSSGETDEFHTPMPMTDTAPLGLQFEMVAGRFYNFNVGVWAYGDNTAGVGTSGALGFIGMKVATMTIDGPHDV